MRIVNLKLSVCHDASRFFLWNFEYKKEAAVLGIEEKKN